MDEAVDAAIFWDYLCPWCYCLYRRVERYVAERPERLRLSWWPFPLRPEPDGRRVDEHTIAVWGGAQALLADMDVELVQWPEHTPLPRTSLPPLVASVAAAEQGEEAFTALHERIFRLYFHENADIAAGDVLARAVEESGLDVAAFAASMASGRPLRRLRQLYDDAVGLGVRRVPVTFMRGAAGTVRLDGAPSQEQLEDAVAAALRPAGSRPTGSFPP